ncbi:MAG: hypothetical protein ABW321_07150 [Polyangiales bacterium]
MSPSPRVGLAITHDFRGVPLPSGQHAQVWLHREADELCIAVDAPFFGDPAPSTPVGATDRLWEHEVCEVFIADADEHYLEVELSPHGHHLVLELRGVRRVVRSCLPISYTVQVDPAGRYHGQARVPWQYLPSAAARVNAYLIHGEGPARRYHAHSPTGGEVPDFHRLASFVPFQLA